MDYSTMQVIIRYIPKHYCYNVFGCILFNQIFQRQETHLKYSENRVDKNNEMCLYENVCFSSYICGDVNM